MEQNRRSEAIAMYRTYSGPYAGATTSQRETLAKALETSSFPPPAVKDDVSKEIFDMAVDYVKRNPNEFDSAIKRFEEVATKAKGTPWEEKSRAAILRLEQARDRAIADMMNMLKQRADMLIKQGNLPDAQKLYREYNGPLAASTVAQRMKAADALESPDSGAPTALDSRALAMLAQASKSYQERKQDVSEHYDRNMQMLATNYLQNLGDLADFMRKSNDHSKERLVKQEQVRFQKEKTVPANPSIKPFDDLKKLQTWYMDEKADMDKQKSRIVVKNAEGFLDYLKNVERELTANGQKNVIPNVRDLSNRVSSDPDLKDAQQFLAKRDKEKK